MGAEQQGSRTLLSALFAALTIAARLPFLLSHRIAFDSDEAVEGLMARHLLHGELPAFFWGQAFKGVPEVYASAGAFAIFGPSVTVLKSVTLAFFAAFIALNFVLLDKIAGRWIAAAASLLLIVCPPALVFWSLDASAEYALLMLLGTIFILLCVEKTKNKEPKTVFLAAAIGIVVGLAFWVQQLFIIYLVPVVITLLARSKPEVRTGMWRLRAVPMTLIVVAALYLALASIAFVTGGFSFALGRVELGARAPQKMLRIALGLGGVAALLQLWHGTPRNARRRVVMRVWPFGAGFLAGYSPVLLYSMLVEPAHSPLRNANLHQLIQAAPDIFGHVVPIILGFTLATTERLPIPLVAVVPGIAALGAYLWAHRRDFGRSLPDSFFPIFIVSVPMVFVFSGAYLDTQSYRYLVPWYAGLAVAWAGGSLVLAGIAEARHPMTERRPGNGRAQLQLRESIAAVLLGTILAIHAWQQVLWYRGLRPDTQSIATIDCLRRNGIRGGYADYWTSYTLTFLSNEDIIIAPTNGVDRYPAYSEFVRLLPESQRVTLKPDTTYCR